MNYIQKILSLADNYLFSRLSKKHTTATFWYLPEPARIETAADLISYQNCKPNVPPYLIDYRKKLNYTLKNQDGIIVLPYNKPIGDQINPEAAFQYALGLHDSHNLKLFFHYADYFIERQTTEGFWNYHFDWFTAKAPWTSALAQARGASVMLRAWLHSEQDIYLNACKNALAKFLVPTSNGGFLQLFSEENCHYYEEYPLMPTGVINGFMAALISIWEVSFWLSDPCIYKLWQQGIVSLEKMLPYYSIGWWSLYDRDIKTPILNVNSPRYHYLEIQYLKVLSILSNSTFITDEYKKRLKQYQQLYARIKAYGFKIVRKILYR